MQNFKVFKTNKGNERNNNFRAVITIQVKKNNRPLVLLLLYNLI